MGRWLRIIVLAVALALPITFVLGTRQNYFGRDSGTLRIRDSFENGLGDWMTDADVPQDPDNLGHTVEWDIACVSDISHTGNRSLRLFIDGREDDGTIWIERKINAKRPSGTKVKISFELYSDSESFNTIAAVCAYVGLRDPEFEGDFVVLGYANEVEGWKHYAYETTLDVDQINEVWIAIGISVRWETMMTYYIDEVNLEIG